MKRYVLLGCAALFLAVFVYRGDVFPLLSPLLALPDVPGGVPTLTVFLMLFSFFHAWYVLGWRHTLVFFVLSAVISWGFEQVGVETGLIYGAYHYTEGLGIRLGHVPLLIPLAWFMMIYPCYVIANLITNGQLTGTRGSIRRLVWLSFLGAIVMTAWDVVMDPVMSGPVYRFWIWERGGPYFGVPIQNFVGWVLTTFVVYLVYRLFERRVALRPAGPLTVAIAAMPLVAYGTMMLSNTLTANPEAMRVVAPFAMGLPVAAAADKLLKFGAG